MIRAVTLTPEWAWAVCHLDKRVENRTWAPYQFVGQTFALHAGAAKPQWRAVEIMACCADWSMYGYARDFKKGDTIVNRPDRKLVTGAIVATFTLAGIRAVRDVDAVGWECGPFCWDFADVKLLDRPIPCRGMLGLWDATKLMENAR